MSVEIIYSHIPKCGGVSFRKALLDHYKPNEILHPWFWFQTRPEYQKAIDMWQDYPKLKRQWDKATDKIHPNVKIIMGHFPMRLFDGLYPDATRIIWLRNPVDRVISAYYHYTRNEFLVGDHTQPFKPRSPSMSLHDFALLPRQQNVQQHFYTSASVFDFVGIVEHYQDSLNRFARAIGWEEQPTLAHYNRGMYEEVDKETKEHIRNLNRYDVQLYEHWKEIWYGKD